VSNKLKPVYGCVQGGHAVAQWLLDNKSTQTWNNQYLIYVYVDIEKWIYKLQLNNEKFSIFYEPDLDNKPTAIAIESDGKMFKNLKMVE
jgi:predicted alpha/beta-fold hydrolase